MFNLRHALLPYAASYGLVQSFASPASTFDSGARIVGLATLLGSLTVLVYRLGVWRQDMENTKDRIAVEVKAHRDESTVNFDRIERRLDAIDHVVTGEAHYRARIERRQTRTERRIERLETAIGLTGAEGE